MVINSYSRCLFRLLAPALWRMFHIVVSPHNCLSIILMVYKPNITKCTPPSVLLIGQNTSSRFLIGQYLLTLHCRLLENTLLLTGEWFWKYCSKKIRRLYNKSYQIYICMFVRTLDIKVKVFFSKMTKFLKRFYTTWRLKEYPTSWSCPEGSEFTLLQWSLTILNWN